MIFMVWTVYCKRKLGINLLKEALFWSSKHLWIFYGLNRPVAWPTGVQLLVFFCSSIPVVLIDTTGISRCRSQHVSVESSSLRHHSIYLWFICFTWWSIDELGNLHADRKTVCFELWQKLRARLGARKAGLGPPVFLYWPFRGGASVVVPCCSCCLCLCFGSAVMLVACFVNFR